MEIDVDSLFDSVATKIQELIQDQADVKSGMLRWLDFCEQLAPNHTSLWNDFRELDFDGDVLKLCQWTLSLFEKEPPSESITGLYFGLINPAGANGGPSLQMCLVGSSSYVDGGDNPDWAYDVAYEPAGRYANSDVLPRVYESIFAQEIDDLNYLGEPVLGYGYTALVASHLFRNMKPELLGAASYRCIAVGHPSGDLYEIGVARRGDD